MPAMLEAHAHVTTLWREGDPGPAPAWGPPGTALSLQAGLTGGHSAGRHLFSGQKSNLQAFPSLALTLRGAASESGRAEEGTRAFQLPPSTLSFRDSMTPTDSPCAHQWSQALFSGEEVCLGLEEEIQ